MSEFQWIDGGITCARGFQAAGVHCGIRKNKSKRDLALIVCEKPCDAAAVYTRNLVQSAPIQVTRENICATAGHRRDHLQQRQRQYLQRRRCGNGTTACARRGGERLRGATSGMSLSPRPA